jgi:hypothetical protein
MKEISAALVRAQKAFGPALKTSSNPHFKSRYADLATVVEAVIDGLNSNGIALVQKTALCDTGVIVETTFIHESGESMSTGQLHVPASKHDAQGYGSALTYARRYSLMAACGVAPEDDDGNAAVAARPAPAQRRQEPLAGPNELSAITSLAASVGVPMDAIAATYGINSIDQLPLSKVAEVIARLQKKAAQAKES